MEIRQLRHFVAVADTLNFRRAAERVNLTQQAISKSIIQLETQIGFRLLDRDRQSVRLTSFGELLLPYARTIIAEVQRFDDVLGDVVGRRFGQLKIGATPTLAADIVPSALRIFQERHPGIRVLIEHGDFVGLRDQMLEGALDLVLSTAPDEVPSHLVAITTIGTDANVVAVRAGHPLADGGAVDCARLAGWPRAALTRFHKAETYLAILFGEVGLPVPPPAIAIASPALSLSWVEQTDHWWAAPRALMAGALREGRLTMLPLPIVDTSWPLVIATRRYATRSPAVLAFSEIVAAQTGGDNGGTSR